MALDSIEKERIELIKEWWRQNKIWVSISVFVFVAIIVAWLSWKGWQQKNNQEASQIYANFEQVLKNDSTDKTAESNLKTAIDLAGQLHQNYSSSAFSWMAGLSLAKKSYLSGNVGVAEQQLKIVFDESKSSYRVLAALDLMSLYIEQKKYDAALSLSDWSYPDGFVALFEDRKGDVYLAQKKIKEARVAYQKALSAASSNSQLKETIGLKLASLSA